MCATSRRVAVVLVLAVCTAAGCDGSKTAVPTPFAPTPQPPAPVPPVTTTLTATMQIRSGREGLPALGGASVRVGDQQAVADPSGRAVFVDVTATDDVVVEAPGHYTFRTRLSAPTPVITLWPIGDGVYDWFWLVLTSYRGPDYDYVLLRPTADITLRLEGVLGQEPYRSVWARAVSLIADAVASGDPGAPRVRLVTQGGTPVQLVPREHCEGVQWQVSGFVLTPPPELPLTSLERAGDLHAVLEVVAGLLGFSLDSERGMFGIGSPTGLSPLERTALRMRMLRKPGTTFDGTTEHDAVEPRSGTYWWGYPCR